MKKNLTILSVATFALFSMVACTKDNSTFTPKDSAETEFLAQENADETSILAVASTQKKKSWVIALNGANERPTPVNTPTIGEARINLYANGGNYSLTYNILLKKIPSGTNITAAHIHAGASNATGGVVEGLFTVTRGSLVNFGIKGQRITLSQTMFNDLLNGTNPYYINVHSNTFPGGIIRGQLQ